MSAERMIPIPHGLEGERMATLIGRPDSQIAQPDLQLVQTVRVFQGGRVHGAAA